LEVTGETVGFFVRVVEVCGLGGVVVRMVGFERCAGLVDPEWKIANEPNVTTTTRAAITAANAAARTNRGRPLLRSARFEESVERDATDLSIRPSKCAGGT
jgi:hypothetical protein